MDEQKKILTEQETQKVLGGTDLNLKNKCANCGFIFEYRQNVPTECPNCHTKGFFDLIGSEN